MVWMEAWPSEIWDLFEGGVALVGEFGERPAEVVGGDLDADPPAVFCHHLEDGLRGHAVAHDAIALVDGAQQPAARDAGSQHPFVDGQFGPGRHGHGADALAFADQVDEHPAGVALLDVIDREPRQLLAAQAAAEEQTKQNPIAFSPVGRAVRQSEQLFGLAGGQPVAGAGAMAPGALHATDGGGELGGEDPVIGRFIGELAQRAQPDVDGRRREILLVEGGAVALDRRFIEGGPAVRGRPPVEVFERGAVGPAGVGGGEAVEDERLEAEPGLVAGGEGEVGHFLDSIPYSRR